MTISCQFGDNQFGDVDAHGSTIHAQAASSEAEHQAIARNERGDAHGTPETVAGMDTSVLDCVASVINAGTPSVTAKSQLARIPTTVIRIIQQKVQCGITEFAIDTCGN